MTALLIIAGGAALIGLYALVYVASNKALSTASNGTTQGEANHDQE